LFARKPAPVQIAYLAYPGTTGMTAMDYRLTDPYLDPPGTHDELYSERSIRLPDTFWCFDPAALELNLPAADLPEPGDLPAQRNGHVTFGCLNSFCKINAGVLHLWTRVLRAVPISRLLLLAPVGSARRWALDELTRAGLNPDRVEFVAQQPRRNYLDEYRRIDIGLDTLPYNGHTTSLDSFWMGVPVVTRIGPTVMGRAGLSLLSNLHLTELAGRDDDQFVQIAIDLAHDLPRLTELRRNLRLRMMASPLTDAKRFARNIESAYRQVWRAWCAGNEPAPQLVNPDS
jgi:predicted O-linked N-acetylglucosamine transferase (SPINDLY family)